MNKFPAFSPEFVWWELSMPEGQCYYAWAIENDPWLALGGVRRISRGFVGRQVDKLVKIAKDHYKLK